MKNRFLNLMLTFSLSILTILPQTYGTEARLSSLLIQAGSHIPSNWHKIVVAGQNNPGLLNDALKMVRLMEASGEFRLTAVRKLALPASMALWNAMQNNSAQIGLAAGVIAALYTGYYGFNLFALVNGNIRMARDVAGGHPAFNFGGIAESFIPRCISKIIMIPANLVDVLLGGARRAEWSFLARQIRWSAMEAYHDGVEWLILGTAAAALVGGASHLLTDGYNDHLSLELFFERK